MVIKKRICNSYVLYEFIVKNNKNFNLVLMFTMLHRIFQDL